MPFNGSGTFDRVHNWQQDSSNAINITDSRMDAEDDGFATGLSNAICKDGQTTITANLPMNTFRHTGVGDGVNRTDYASLGQNQDGVINWVVAGGTADAITANYTPALTALKDGQLCFIRATAANATTTPTFAPNGLTAHTITKLGGIALAPGDIPGNLSEIILRYNLANTRWELQNPASGVIAGGTAGGTANALTVTPSPAISAYYTRLTISFTASAANTGAATLNISGLGAKNIYKKGPAGITALNGGEIQSGDLVTVMYDGTQFQIMGATAFAQLQYITNSIGADVSMTVQNQYYDAPSINAGTVGVWFASGTVTVEDTAAAATFGAKLWDGTTVIASAVTTSVGASNPVSISLSGYITNPAGNIRISCTDSNVSPAGKIIHNASGTGKDSTLSVIRMS